MWQLSSHKQKLLKVRLQLVQRCMDHAQVVTAQQVRAAPAVLSTKAK
jgi:hypothetical protein